ncbi:MAG: response regulator [Anaerolineales bacterium]|nr:response regulator [Anaerolineales bacterium]
MSREKGRILLVDDEPKLVRLVQEVLIAMGYEVISTGKGSTAIKLVAVEQPDLLLLDIVLAGDIDGYEVARRVREFSEVPIIMLTAKVREADVLHGFNAGADDYLTKPFNSQELLARIRAVLKRAQIQPSESDQTEIRCGDLRIDLVRRRVTIGNIDVHLTRTEYNLLHELAQHRNQVLLHEQLLCVVWGPEYRDDIDYLRAYIRYLRKKLEKDPSNPQMILTSQGVGYLLSCPDDTANDT